MEPKNLLIVVHKDNIHNYLIQKLENININDNECLLCKKFRERLGRNRIRHVFKCIKM